MTSEFESEFPSNSHRSREESAPVEETKVVEKIVTGSVIRQKPPIGKRFAKLFIAEDPKVVLEYVLTERAIPAVRDLAVDMVTSYFERLVQGSVLGGTRRGVRSTGAPGYVSYNRYSSPSRPVARTTENPRQGIGRPEKRKISIDDIVLESRPEAEEVIKGLFNLILKYEQATVAELYELCGVVGDFTDNKWGWTDIRGADVQRVRNGYLLRLPEPVSLTE